MFGDSVDVVILRHLLKDPGSLMIQFEKPSTSQKCLHSCISKNNHCSVLKCISYVEILLPSRYKTTLTQLLEDVRELTHYFKS